MKLIYEVEAVKALRRMPAKDREMLCRKLATYAVTGAGDVVEMAGSESWRLRHGDRRAIFVVRGDMIVVRIAHRSEVYRQEGTMNEAVSLTGEPMIVMTRAEYEALVEDIGDSAIADHAHSLHPDAPAMPSELVEAVFNHGLHPLAAWRRSCELSEAQLAERSGVSEDLIRAIEAGSEDPRLSTLRALASALKLGTEDIVD